MTAYLMWGLDIDRVGLGTPITKAEYDRAKAEMEGNGQVVEIDWSPWRNGGSEGTPTGKRLAMIFKRIFRH
jgi:hypothetical protein